MQKTQIKFWCSMECNGIDYCSAWCLVEDESICLVTNFVISPQEGPESDQICYTNRKAGNHILKATATQSRTHYDRPASVLTKGIFNYDFWTTITVLDLDPNPFMLFEFQSEVLVRVIQIRLTGNPGEHPSDQTEIRLGSSMPAGPTDFSQLELIGMTFDNPRNYEFRTFHVDPPVKAKFLGILETDGTRLGFTFIEVFS